MNVALGVRALRWTAVATGGALIGASASAAFADVAVGPAPLVLGGFALAALACGAVFVLLAVIAGVILLRHLMKRPPAETPTAPAPVTPDEPSPPQE